MLYEVTTVRPDSSCDSWEEQCSEEGFGWRHLQEEVRRLEAVVGLAGDGHLPEEYHCCHYTTDTTVTTFTTVTTEPWLHPLSAITCGCRQSREIYPGASATPVRLLSPPELGSSQCGPVSSWPHLASHPSSSKRKHLRSFPIQRREADTLILILSAATRRPNEWVVTWEHGPDAGTGAPHLSLLVGLVVGVELRPAVVPGAAVLPARGGPDLHRQGDVPHVVLGQGGEGGGAGGHLALHVPGGALGLQAGEQGGCWEGDLQGDVLLALLLHEAGGEAPGGGGVVEAGVVGQGGGQGGGEGGVGEEAGGQAQGLEAAWQGGGAWGGRCRDTGWRGAMTLWHDSKRNQLRQRIQFREFGSKMHCNAFISYDIG